MSGHPFVRPGQVAPHLPAPDACVRCGQPEAAHGTGAELRARRTAAAAALADFGRYSSGEAIAAGGIFDWQTAALRLAAELQSLLGQLDAEPPGIAGYDLVVRQALRDAIRYQRAAAGPDSQGQEGLYRAAAQHFGINLGTGLADAVPDPARQLVQIRLVLDSFDWETDDRQYALEQIDDILRGER